MKNATLIFIAVALMAAAFTTVNDNKSLARVQRFQGKEVYVMSEPLREYEVVERISDFGITLKSCEVQNLVEMFVNKSIRKKVNFDAVIVDGNSKASLIKFKD